MKLKTIALTCIATVATMMATQAQTWNVGGNAVGAASKVGTTTNFPMQMITNNATRMTVTSAGKVGIGTTAPTATFQVQKSTLADVLVKSTGNGAQLTIDRAGNGWEAVTRYAQTGTTLWKTGLNVNSIGTAEYVIRNENIFADALTIGSLTNNVGLGTASPTSPLSFPNTLGNKISFFNSGPNNDFGIGINTGVMQFFTAGQDKIAFGWGNSNSFNENLSVSTGTGQLKYSNLLGNKISFFNSGPNNDYGIGINTGVMQFFTAGQDKIAFGWGNSNSFIETMTFLTGTGQLGLGTSTPAYKLDVCGTIRAKEVRVATGWCDYVFADDYKLPALNDVEAFIKANKHLPDVTPGSIIESEGLEVGKTSAQMIKKIEELKLYVIDLQKQLNELKETKK